MEEGPRALPQKVIITLKELFYQKGYPENSLFFEPIYFFSLGELSFEFSLAAVVNFDSKPLLILDYHPSQRGLSSFERPLLSIARLFFDPLPYFAFLTNLSDFICIEVYTPKILKGTSEILPNFKDLLAYTPPPLKPYKREIEEKILAFYLSGG